MISKRFRFKGNAGLRNTYRKGRTVSSQNLSLKFVENTKNQNWHLAVVVSKKTAKSAVKRNRIRRRIYETIRQNGQLDGQTRDVIITVHNESLADIPPIELKKEIDNLVKKLT